MKLLGKLQSGASARSAVMTSGLNEKQEKLIERYVERKWRSFVVALAVAWTYDFGSLLVIFLTDTADTPLTASFVVMFTGEVVGISLTAYVASRLYYSRRHTIYRVYHTRFYDDRRYTHVSFGDARQGPSGSYLDRRLIAWR